MPIARIQAPDGRIARFDMPEGTTPEEAQAYADNFFKQQAQQPAASQQAQPQSDTNTPSRIAKAAGRGAYERFADYASIPGELAVKGAQAAGLNVASPKDTTTFIMDSLRQGGMLNKPEDTQTGTEKFASGAGKGAVDIAALLAPITGVAKVTGSVPYLGKAAKLLSQAPKTQFALGALGGGTTEATDNPLAGLAAMVLTPIAGGAALKVAAPAIAKAGEKVGISSLAALKPNTTPADSMAALLEKEGIQLTPGQSTGSKLAKYTESAFAALPFTGGKQEAINQAQREAFTAAAARRAGLDVKALTPDVIAAAHSTLSNTIGDIAKSSRPNIAKPVAQPSAYEIMSLRSSADAGDFIAQAKLAELLKTPKYSINSEWGAKLYEIETALDKAAPETISRTQKFINDFKDAAVQGNGEKLYNIKKQIDKALNGADSDLKHHLGNVRELVLDAVRSGLKGEQEAAFDAARRNMANLFVLENAVAGAGEKAAEGYITPASLRQALSASVGKQGYVRGKGDLNELAHAAVARMTPVPTSGTAERSMAISLLTGGLGAGGYAIGNIPGTLAALALPKVAQTAYYSKFARNMAAKGRNVPSGSVTDAIAAEQIGSLAAPDNRKMIPPHKNRGN